MILQRIRDSYVARGMAVYLSISMIFQMTYPTASFALTGGPSQPEVQSFSPVGTSDMVDLTSGDFNYNIPLLDVGGYPINMIYNGDITMDQEASWVGLGWNINPGVINRNMRGLPDDFNGDEVKKTTYMKPNITIGVDLGIGPDEIFGLDVNQVAGNGGIDLNVGLGVQYNNYNGASVSTSLALGTNNDGMNANLGLQGNSNGGLSISPSVSYDKVLKDKEGKKYKSTRQSVGISFNSISGLTDMSIRTNLEGKVAKKTRQLKEGATLSLTPNTYTPQINHERNSLSVSFGIKGGTVGFGVENSASIGAMYSSAWLKKNGEEVTHKAYGYLHSEHAGLRAMLDFNREKDAAYNDGTTNLPITNYTYDAYSIQGQGVSGAYRPYRSEVGAVYDNRAISLSESANGNFDVSGGMLANLGTDVKVNTSESYSGVWSQDNGALSVFNFKGTTNGFDNNTNDLYEPYYYKQSGELAVDHDDIYKQISGDKPVQIPLERYGVWGVKTLPTLEEKRSSGYVSHYNGNLNLQRTKRVNRNQLISTLTKAEAREVGVRKYVVPDVPEHHVSEVTVTKNDGSRYVYGIPLYNHHQEDVTFSISKRGGLPSSNAKTGLVSYDPTTDNKANNGKGKDEFYSKTVLPPYAHSYLISEVLSHDYVDVNNNGADDADYGTYTRFDYDDDLTKANPLGAYKWRVPYKENHANFNEGLKAEHQDETASYIYGEKDIRYLKTITTKTHVAVFHTSSREDALETIDKNGGKGSRSMKKLDKISLYAKGDWNKNNGVYANMTPIKEVHFEYAGAGNELCQNGLPNANGSRGKLTLKKVYFTYGKSHKAKWSPYEFNYDGLNPSYNLKGYNVWGGYKENPTQPTGVDLSNPFDLAENGVLTNPEFPYVDQNQTQEDQNSAVWSLKSIKLPSGGIITIEYESDDYAYVQDRRAMQMVKIIGAGGTPTSTPSDLLFDGQINNNYLFFQKPTGVTGKDFILNSGIKNEKMYFRFLLDLDNKGHYDFVTGYCDILNYSENDSNSTTGWVQINNVGMKDNGNGPDINPITKTGWNYTRMHLPKIAGNQPNNLPADNQTQTAQGVKNMAKALANAAMVRDIINLARGINTRLKQEKYSRKFIQGKSWIRLTNPDGHKLGGGSRVKRILMSDQWSNMVNGATTSVYGQEFNYDSEETITQTNGDVVKISSGVATYEPIQSKENPFVQPIFMTTKHLLVPDDEHFIEEPLGESFFPSPTVTYSRVEVKNIVPNGLENHASGKVIHEFYTSKDYPTIVDNDLLTPERRSTFSKFSLVKGFQKDYMNASQGYVVINNDMNGKQKAQWVLPEGAADISDAISGVEYLYNLDATSSNIFSNADDPFEATSVNSRPGSLNNQCILIHKNGKIKSGTIGIEYDAIADFREHGTENTSRGANAELSTFLVGIFPGIVPSIWPTFSYSHTRFRSAVFTKVINQHGILREVVAHDLGAKVSTKNLAWDAETGEVLLTSVKNEYADEIFTLNYPAHWGYDRMGLASQNIGLETTVTNTSAGWYSNSKADKYFVKGDEVLLGGTQKAWVLKVNPTYIFLIDSDGNPITTSIGNDTSVKVIRSGRRNQQALAIGSITLKENPIQPDGNGGYYSLQEVITSTNANQNQILAASAVEYDDNWRTYAGVNKEGPNKDECICTLDIKAETCFSDMLQSAFSYVICGCSGSMNNKAYQCSIEEWSNLDYSKFTLIAKKETNQLILNHYKFTCPIILEFDDYIFETDDLSFLSKNCVYEDVKGVIKCGYDFFGNFDYKEENCGKDITVTGEFLGNLPGLEGKIAKFTIKKGAECFPQFFDCETVTSPSSCIDNDCDLIVGDITNPFVQAIKGIWRTKKSSIYLGERNQNNAAVYTNTPNANLDLREDGSYTTFIPFWSYDNNQWNPSTSGDWTWASKITNYSPVGQEVENQDALSRYSGATFGYNHSLATAVANNAQQNQIAFDGFEDYDFDSDNLCSNKKHFGFVCHKNQLSTHEAHSGRYSILVKNSNAQETFTSVSSKHQLKSALDPVQNTASGATPYVLRNEDVMNTFGPSTVFNPGEQGYGETAVEYIFSYWQKETTSNNEVIDYVNIVPSIKIGGTELLGVPHSKSKIIDGWQKVEYRFKIPNGSTGMLEVSFVDTHSSSSYIDDVRIHPFNSSMKSYVYDPLSLRLWAELDDNNYATFYEYDEEGKLLRIKKETERGIQTIQESRSSSVK